MVFSFCYCSFFFFFQAEDGIRDHCVTGVQTCALPISPRWPNGGTYRWANVEGPLGDAVHASYGLIDGGQTAVMEMASASGFSLVSAAGRDVRRASTYGFGQLLDAALTTGAKTIICGIGGSATN